MPDAVLPASSQHDQWMLAALAVAAQAAHSGDVPVGALLLDASGEALAVGRNEREEHADPTAHAEIVALRAAAREAGTWQLPGTTLVVTLEPCVMCAGAILAARVETVVFGAWDDKAGAVGSVYDVLRDRRLNHRVEVFAGVRADECAELLTDFFRSAAGGGLRGASGSSARRNDEGRPAALE